MAGGLTINATLSTQLTVERSGVAGLALNVETDSSWTLFDRVGGGWNTSIVSSGGRVGIGQLPSHPLHMASGAHVTTGGVWTNASDARLKTNVRPLSYGLSDLLKLQPVAYTFRADGSKQIGFLAQDVRAVMPELVTGKEGDIAKGETLGLSYGQLTAVLVAAMKEMEAENDELRANLKAANDNHDRLRAEVELLKDAIGN